MPEPKGVACDPFSVSNQARFDVSITMISATYSRDEIDESIKNDVPYFAPLIHDVEIIEFPTGHWPQLRKPEELAAHIRSAL